MKKPGPSTGATIHYRDIGDYLNREAKLEILAGSRLATTEWQAVVPNEHGDWIHQRSDTFQTLQPLASIFTMQTQGLVTRRDPWCYNSSESKLRTNIKNTVDFYNAQVAAFQSARRAGSPDSKSKSADDFVEHDPQKFHWNVETYRDLSNAVQYSVADAGFSVGSYRPFFKQALYLDQRLISRIGKFPEIYPDRSAANLCMCVTGTGVNVPFYALMTETVPDDAFTGHSVCLPRYRYVLTQALTHPPEPDNPELERVSNINPAGPSQVPGTLRCLGHIRG